MKNNRIVVWFRNDFHVSDNETLISAIQQGGKIILVYCFDPQHVENTKLGPQIVH